MATRAAVDRCGPGHALAPQRSAPWARECGSEQNYTASRSSSICRLTKSPAGRGLTGSPRSGRRSRFSGTPWTTSSTPFLGFRRLMFLCRRWWNSCRTSSSSSPRVCRPLLSRSVIDVPVVSRTSRRELRFTSRSWRNSWWKCRPSSASSSSGFPSRSSTIHFRVFVGVVFKVFSAHKVYAQERVRSALLSRSLTFLLVEVPILTLQLVLMTPVRESCGEPAHPS